jgi:hypothetical protein
MAYDAMGRYIPDQVQRSLPAPTGENPAGGPLAGGSGRNILLEQERQGALYNRNTKVQPQPARPQGSPSDAANMLGMDYEKTQDLIRQLTDPVGMAGSQGPLPNQGGYFNTQLPQQPTGFMPAGNTQLNIPNAPTGGLSTGQVAGGLALGGMLGGNFDFGNLLKATGNYYGSEQGIQAAYGAGQAGLGMAEQMGQRAADTAQFKPYTVTTGLGKAATTPQGGYTLELSPQQQALQAQLMGQAQNLFGQVGQDPAAQQAALYEQIRATQLPEEERQRLAMQENLFASGRGGLQTAQYGGSPEQFAYEKARQEAMAGASLAARQQAMAEQQQALQGATGLLSAGYSPQQQALNALGAGTDIANLAGTAGRSAATLQGQLGQSGLQSYMQGTQLATNLQQQQMQNLLSAALGTGTEGSGLIGGLGTALGMGDAKTPDWLKSVGDYFGLGGASGSADVAAAGGLFASLFGGNKNTTAAPQQTPTGSQSSAAINPLTGQPYYTSTLGGGI